MTLKLAFSHCNIRRQPVLRHLIDAVWRLRKVGQARQQVAQVHGRLRAPSQCVSRSNYGPDICNSQAVTH